MKSWIGRERSSTPAVSFKSIWKYSGSSHSDGVVFMCTFSYRIASFHVSKTTELRHLNFFLWVLSIIKRLHDSILTSTPFFLELANGPKHFPSPWIRLMFILSPSACHELSQWQLRGVKFLQWNAWCNFCLAFLMTLKQMLDYLAKFRLSGMVSGLDLRPDFHILLTINPATSFWYHYVWIPAVE